MKCVVWRNDDNDELKLLLGTTYLKTPEKRIRRKLTILPGDVMKDKEQSRCSTDEGRLERVKTFFTSRNERVGEHDGSTRAKYETMV